MGFFNLEALDFETYQNDVFFLFAPRKQAAGTTANCSVHLSAWMLVANSQEGCCCTDRSSCYAKRKQLGQETLSLCVIKHRGVIKHNDYISTRSVALWHLKFRFLFFVSTNPNRVPRHWPCLRQNLGTQRWPVTGRFFGGLAELATWTLGSCFEITSFWIFGLFFFLFWIFLSLVWPTFCRKMWKLFFCQNSKWWSWRIRS